VFAINWPLSGFGVFRTNSCVNADGSGGNFAGFERMNLNKLSRGLLSGKNERIRIYFDLYDRDIAGIYKL
jgi:hypothetical protein